MCGSFLILESNDCEFLYIISVVAFIVCSYPVLIDTTQSFVVCYVFVFLFFYFSDIDGFCSYLTKLSLLQSLEKAQRRSRFFNQTPAQRRLGYIQEAPRPPPHPQKSPNQWRAFTAEIHPPHPTQEHSYQHPKTTPHTPQPPQHQPPSFHPPAQAHSPA